MNRFQIVAIAGLAAVIACAVAIAVAVLGDRGAGDAGSDGSLRPDALAKPVKPGYPVAGMVRGNGPGGVTIFLQGTVFDMTMTAEDGSFSFEDVLPGEYSVTAARAGAAFARDRCEIVVPSQQALSLSFELASAPAPAPDGRRKPALPAPWWGYRLFALLPTSFYAYAYPAPPPPAPYPVPRTPVSGRGEKSARAGMSAGARDGAVELCLRAVGDADSRVRAEAALALGRIGTRSDRVMEALSAARSDSDADVRSCAALASGLLGGPELADELLRTAASQEAAMPHRCASAVAAGLCGGEPQINGLANIASNGKGDAIKAAALISAATTGTSRASYLALNALFSNNPAELQAAAACCLGSHPGRTFMTGSGRRQRSIDLCDMLCKRALNKETATAVRAAIPNVVARFEVSAEEVNSLLQLMRLDRSADVVMNAAVGAGAAASKLPPGDPARTFALEALNRIATGSGDANLRPFAVFAMALCGGPDAGELLLGILDSNDHPDSRAAAAAGLGIAGHAAAVPLLCAEVERPRSSGDARGMSMLALGMIGEEEGLAFLRSVVESANIPYLRWWAGAGLGLAKDPSGFELLAGMTADRNRITRDGALRAIAMYRDDRAACALSNRFEREDNREIRALIVRLLGECCRGDDRRLERVAAAFPPDLLFALGDAGLLLYLRR